MSFAVGDYFMSEFSVGTCVDVTMQFAAKGGSFDVYAVDEEFENMDTRNPIKATALLAAKIKSQVGGPNVYCEAVSASSVKTIWITWKMPDPAVPVVFISEEDGLYYALGHDAGSVTSLEVQMVDDKVVCSAADQAKITWFKRPAPDEFLSFVGSSAFTLQTAADGDFLTNNAGADLESGATVASCFKVNGTSLAFAMSGSTLFCGADGPVVAAPTSVTQYVVDDIVIDNNVSAYTFSRTFNNTNYSTICLPYTVPAAKFSGFTLYNITGVERDSKTNKVTYFTMEESEVLEAGVPYIIQADAAGTVRLPYAGNRYTGSTRPVATGLVGNLTGATFQINASDNAYILSQNEAHLIAGTATANIANNRAYLDLNSVDAPASTSPRRVVLGVYETEQEDVVTDLDALLETAAVLDWSKPVYNLMGQRVSEGATGVLIQDGQKFMIR